ncbi:MAG: SEC-C domain-containing protein [Deltaproteobacteria bacterium]|nr:SEC-C domain-containing protein [Deltaproteobacteria bacterium]
MPDVLVRGPGRNDPCPCGANRKAKKCCGSGGRWEKPPLGSLLTAATASSSAVDRCYAAPLGGCTGSLSREHYFSKNLLQSLTNAGVVEPRGLFSGPNDPKKIGINSLTAKILCEGHNSVLSPLDMVGGRFFEVFHRIHATPWSPRSESFELFSGHDVERWMLKTMLGFAKSGIAPDQGRRVRLSAAFEVQLLRHVFEGVPLPEGAGLYFVEPIGGRFTPGQQSFQLIFNRPDEHTGELWGLQTDMNGFSFAILLLQPQTGASGHYNEAWYRPRQVWVRHLGVRRVVEFSWHESRRTDVVHLVGGTEAPS